MIPFDFFNAPTSSQRYINKLLAENLDVFVIVSLDDILIYIDKTDNVNTVLLVFDQPKKHSLYTNLNKYCFHEFEMQLLSYIVSS